MTKELEDIMIDFNEYLETVTVNLRHRETGVQDIIANIRTKIDEFSKGTTEIISDMRKDLEQGRAVIEELLKNISAIKPTSSTTLPMITTSFVKPMTLPAMRTTTTTLTEPSSSSSFLE